MFRRWLGGLALAISVSIAPVWANENHDVYSDDSESALETTVSSEHLGPSSVAFSHDDRENWVHGFQAVVLFLNKITISNYATTNR